MELNDISFSGSILRIPEVPAKEFPLHSITWLQAKVPGAGKKAMPGMSQEQAG